MENRKQPRSPWLRALPLMLGVALMAPATGFAQEQAPNEVRMLNKDSNGMAKVFEPAIMRVEPGGTVDFVAWDFGHDLISVDGLQPDGAPAFTGYKNADTSVTFSVEGVHVYQCAAHKAVGMIGLVVVGDPKVNLDAVIAQYQDNAALSDDAKARLADILTALKSE